MKQVFTSNPNYSLKNPILQTQITFFLNANNRLNRIIWRSETSFAGTKDNVWGNEKRETWDLKGDANEYDLIRAFTHLALGNPADFKELYYILKEHDDVVFPCIKETLQQIKAKFDFD